MTRRLLTLVFALSVASVAGCGDSGHAVSIDVRSDYLPIDEFDAVRLTIDSQLQRIAANRAEDYRAGVRIYDGELTPGDHEVFVALTRAGRAIVSRRVLLRVEVDRGISVVLTRSCADVVCNAETTCVSARCVDPACTPETPELCDDPECELDVECATGMCGSASCVLGSCFQEDDGLCGEGAYCDPSLGCRMRSVDAGVDAGVDASSIDASFIDAASDASPSPDSGIPDSGTPDAGMHDAGSDVPVVSDAGRDVSGPVGNCRNPGDEGLLETYTVNRGINDGFACYQIHGANTAELRTCVQGRVGVSDACAECFAQIVQCTVSNCATPCMTPASSACASCRDAFCDTPFTSCSGYAL